MNSAIATRIATARTAAACERAARALLQGHCATGVRTAARARCWNRNMPVALVVAEHLERELVEVERAHPAEAALVEQRQDVVGAVADRLAELADVRRASAWSLSLRPCPSASFLPTKSNATSERGSSPLASRVAVARTARLGQVRHDAFPDHERGLGRREPVRGEPLDRILALEVARHVARGVDRIAGELREPLALGRLRRRVIDLEERARRRAAAAPRACRSPRRGSRPGGSTADRPRGRRADRGTRRAARATAPSAGTAHRGASRSRGRRRRRSPRPTDRRTAASPTGSPARDTRTPSARSSTRSS